MKLLSTKQVVIRISVIIAMTEFLIMLILQYVPFALTTISAALVNVTLLIFLSTPQIYGWVIAPFVTARDAALEQISLLAYTDPLTQALVLTAIVISFGMTAVIVMMALGAFLSTGSDRIDDAPDDTGSAS